MLGPLLQLVGAQICGEQRLGPQLPQAVEDAVELAVGILDVVPALAIRLGDRLKHVQRVGAIAARNKAAHLVEDRVHTLGDGAG